MKQDSTHTCPIKKAFLHDVVNRRQNYGWFSRLLDLPWSRKKQTAALSVPSQQGRELGPAAGVALRRCRQYFCTVSGSRLKPSLLIIFLSFGSIKQKQKFAWRRRRKLSLSFRERSAGFQCLKGNMDPLGRSLLPPAPAMPWERQVQI